MNTDVQNDKRRGTMVSHREARGVYEAGLTGGPFGPGKPVGP